MPPSVQDNKDKASLWKALAEHQQAVAGLHMRELFAADSGRAASMSIRLDDLMLDYSRHRVTSETLDLLFSLAETSALETAIADMFLGKKINLSEDRPALHTCLRSSGDEDLFVDGTNPAALVRTQLERMQDFVDKLHNGEILSPGGNRIKKVISIGIGGSDLGPRLAIEALKDFRKGTVDVAFVSNLDPKELANVLADTDAASTLVIVVSKSFTTLETMTNANAVRQWLREQGCKTPEAQMIAVTTNPTAAREFGIGDDRIFHFWDWVGGRYSLWSSVGLSIAVGTGMDNFRELLAGAELLDRHFRSEPLRKNIPVILGLLSAWYTNFFAAKSHAVIPYDQSLRLLPEYLSQLVMESNGKSVTRAGTAVEHATSPVVWGAVGTNAQHAFFQMLHQGTQLVPVDFLLPLKSSIDQSQQLKQVSNCLAQGEALMLGRDNPADLNRHFPGNTPSSTIVYSELTPRVLGMLLAMYEHKTFVEATIWDINPFDQWGVELGKKLASSLVEELSAGRADAGEHDASTRQLMAEYLRRNS